MDDWCEGRGYRRLPLSHVWLGGKAGRAGWRCCSRRHGRFSSYAFHASPVRDIIGTTRVYNGAIIREQWDKPRVRTYSGGGSVSKFPSSLGSLAPESTRNFLHLSKFRISIRSRALRLSSTISNGVLRFFLFKYPARFLSCLRTIL